MPKRSKLFHQSTRTSRCQVEGCNLDLTSAKDYHRRHRICESHSKSPKVIVAGSERRFCQQCSRFHNLSEFDDKKRSCRRRLSDHNARRRRPHPEAIPYSSIGFSSSIYEWRPTNFLLNKIPASASNTAWESFCSLKMTQTGTSLISPSAHIDTKQHFPLRHLNSGKDASVGSSDLDEAPVLSRALSLLSTSSWGLNEPEPSSLEQIMQLESQNWPIISSEHVSKEQASYSSSPLVHSVDLHSSADSSQFQDFLSFKTHYEPSFYSSSRIN